MNTSGMGRGVAVPAPVARWNWGAFLLSWIWGIGNRVYISLLALIPLVGFVMAFVLGANGSTWAWQRKRWESVAHFRRVQRRWGIAGAIVFGVFIAVGALSVALAPPAAEAPLSDSVVAEDGSLSMTVPSDWLETDRLDPAADLQAEHEYLEVYIAVYRHRARDFARNLSLRSFARLGAEGLTASLDDARILTGPERRVIAARPAITYRVQGLFEGLQLIYVHTSLETHRGFVEVLGWTIPSLYPDHGPVLDRITASLQIRDAPTAFS